MDFSFISGFSFGPGSDYSRLPSVSNSEYFNYFRRGAFKLVEGQHITPEDDHVVLISTALAERNGLKLGDTITVQCCYDAGGYPNVALKIDDNNMITFYYAYDADATSLYLEQEGVNIKPVRIGDIYADLYVDEIKGNANSLVWVDEKSGVLFCISANCNEEELIRIAESVEAVQ